MHPTPNLLNTIPDFGLKQVQVFLAEDVTSPLLFLAALSY